MSIFYTQIDPYAALRPVESPAYEGPTISGGLPVLDEITLGHYRVVKINGPRWAALNTAAEPGSFQARPVYLDTAEAWARVVWDEAGRVRVGGSSRATPKKTSKPAAQV